MTIELWSARRRLLTRCALFAWVALFGLGHVLEVAVPDRPGVIAWDVRRQLDWLSHLDLEAEATFAGRYFPEGELFFYEFYGFALLNVAETTHTPEDVARAVDTVRRFLPRIDALLTHAPFRAIPRDGGPGSSRVRGGICWFAGQNLLRARMIALSTTPDPSDVARFHADSAQLARAFAASASGVLEAYPGMSWPVDSLLGYRSLQLHDQLYGTRHFATFARWKHTVRRGADPTTGLMPSYVHLDGRPRDVPRGCALSWSLAVLPDLDPELAAEQWRAYRRSFLRCAGGLCLFREYAEHHAGRSADSDSGPIVAGLGMSASAFGLAAARAEGDGEVSEALRRTGELLGLPAISWWGKRYLGGRIGLFDVLSVWTRTIPAPKRASAPLVGTEAGSAHSPTLLLAALITAWGVLAALALRGVRSARAELARVQDRSPTQAVLFALSLGALALHLVSPSFVGAGLVACWCVFGALARVFAFSRLQVHHRSRLERLEQGSHT